MKILVTGALGFVGKNLVAALEAQKDIEKIFSYDMDSTEAELKAACREADFVFNLAGVNRPENRAEFMAGNRDFTVKLLAELESCGNTCPVMYASSIHAGSAAPGEYGLSKLAGEAAVFDHSRRTGAKALVYRFPNIFGKFCRPNYNSVVATFCYNLARDLPITVNDPQTTLSLCYIDDLVNEMLDSLSGQEHRDGDFCTVPTVYGATLGEIAGLLRRIRSCQESLTAFSAHPKSLEAKLFATYISYLPEEKIATALDPHADSRGSFTEILRTEGSGQFSVNISRPGITKGRHWHSTKWEIFVVVSGHGLICQRQLGSERVIRHEVFGEKPTAVRLLPGHTHSIENLSDSHDLVTLMWASENFDPERPDTFFEEV